MHQSSAMSIDLSQNLADKLVRMSKESHSSLNDILIKSIILMEIAINNKKNGNKLAILDNQGKTIDEISGI